MAEYERLPDDVKRFITKRFACFEKNAEIRQAVKDEFGIEVTAAQVTRFNPELASFAGGEELVELFHTTRAAFLNALDDIAIVHKAYRLQKLDQMEREARRAGNFEMSMKLLKQAAEELGGMYEKNRGGLDLITLQKEMDRWAAAVVKHVKDPDALRAIEEELGQTTEDPRRGLKVV